MGKMLVQDLMTPDVLTLHPADTLATLLDLMRDHDIRHVPVVDDEEGLLGLVTHRDVVRGAVSSRDDLPLNVRDDLLAHRTVDTVMSADPMTVEPTDTVEEAAGMMLEHKLGCLPVVEGDRVVGILTESDFVRHVAETC